jgi:co-chaperonin GroES (HSP10)
VTAHDTEPPRATETDRPRDPARVIQPLGDRVLCRRLPHVRKIHSLLLVGGKREDLTVSVVLARGPEVRARPWHLAAGDHVIHPRISGVKYDGTLGRFDGDGELLFLHEHELISVVDPESVVTGEVEIPNDGSRDLTRI